MTNILKPKNPSLFKKLYNWSYTILWNTFATTEMTEIGRRSCLNQMTRPV